MSMEIFNIENNQLRITYQTTKSNEVEVIVYANKSIKKGSVVKILIDQAHLMPVATCLRDISLANKDRHTQPI